MTQIICSGGSWDELADRVADKVFLKIHKNQEPEKTFHPTQEDILFKSLQEAANHYGTCYQTLSKNLGKIEHLRIGRSIKIYKSAIEKAICKYGILSKKR